MQVSVTTTEGLERRIAVEVPLARVDDEIQQRLASMKNTVRMSGFRPGKVPLSVVKQRYGAQVRKEVEAELVRSSLYEAIKNKNLRPADAPKVEMNVSDDVSEGLAYTATFEVYPDLSVVVPGGEIEKLAADIGEQDVSEMIEKLRKQRAEWNVVERSASDGDQLDIDFLGTVDGEAFEGGDAKNYSIIIGSGRFIAGFEEQLVGLTSGETKDVSVSFPDDYQNKELAGKAAMFAVNVNGVQEAKLPGIDDEAFLKSMGVKDVDALKVDIRANMQRELEQAIGARFKESVLNALMDANNIELPNSLVDAEIRTMLNEARQNMGLGASQDSEIISDAIRTSFEARARRRVGLGLLVGELLREHGITVDPVKVRAHIDAQAQSYDDPESVVKWYYEDRSRLSGVEALVLEDQVVEWLASQMSSVEMKKAFSDIMERG